MKVAKLKKILEKVDTSATVTSNSGWECGWTECNGVYYNKKENRVELTQSDNKYEDERHKEKDGWVCLSK